MSYTLERFDNVLLPQYDFSIDVGTGPAQDTSFVLPGGSLYDPKGDDEAPPDKYLIRHTGGYIEDSGADLTDTFRALRAKVWTDGRLYRRWVVDGGTEVEWCNARLLAVDGTKDNSEPFRQIVTCTFARKSPLWYGIPHGAGWTLDSGVLLDTGYVLDDASDTVTLSASPQTVPIINGGLARVENAIVTITAGSSAITALLVAIAGRVEWTFSGTIASGQSLVVDTGAWSVLNNGVDAWGGSPPKFAFGSGHVENGILPLLPGTNNIVVTRTGGGVTSTITVTFKDGWK